MRQHRVGGAAAVVVDAGPGNGWAASARKLHRSAGWGSSARKQINKVFVAPVIEQKAQAALERKGGVGKQCTLYEEKLSL